MLNTRFRQSVNQKPIDLFEAALSIAQGIAYPDLDITATYQRLETIVEQVEMSGVVAEGSSAERAIALAAYLHEEVSLRGNMHDYEDERNSFVNDVLARGLGIPITLSIIYIAIAKRFGLTARSVSLPGHFIVRVEGRESDVFIDPFKGERLSVRECAEQVRQTTGYEGTFRPEWIEPAADKLVVIRILNNLRNIYFKTGEWEKAAAVLAHLEIIVPNDPTYIRDDALIHYNKGDYYTSTKKLEKYLEQAKDQTDATMINMTLGQRLTQWVRLN